MWDFKWNGEVNIPGGSVVKQSTMGLLGTAEDL